VAGSCEHINEQVGFEVLMAVSTKMAVFWVVAPCSLVEVYQRIKNVLMYCISFIYVML
jgi:hypothetical protein